MLRSVRMLTLAALVLSTSFALAADKADQASKATGKKARTAAPAGKQLDATPKPLKAGDKDENVKIAAAKNDRKNVPEAPPEKGGKGRGGGAGSCRVLVSNYTGLLIDVFIDGAHVGMVGRYNDGTMYTGSGTTMFYARAQYDDGSYDTWGPQAMTCESGGLMTWNLRP
jgi:hypothetical protein